MATESQKAQTSSSAANGAGTADRATVMVHIMLDVQGPERSTQHIMAMGRKDAPVALNCRWEDVQGDLAAIGQTLDVAADGIFQCVKGTCGGPGRLIRGDG